MKSEKVWREDAQSEWSLFSNAYAELAPIKSAPKTKEKTSKNFTGTTAELNPAFYFNKKKTDTKGTLIYTPKGYGIIQTINSEAKTICVKVDNVITEFNRKDLSYEIPLSLFYITGKERYEITLHFPIIMTIEELVDEIQKIEFTADTTLKRLFWNGKMLSPSALTLEKMGFVPNTKILAVAEARKLRTVQRYTSVSEGWCYGSKATDGISVTTSKNIKIIGVGLYRPDTECSRNLNGFFRIFERNEEYGKRILQKDVSIPKSETPEDKIFKLMLNLPLTFKKGMIYSLVTELSDGTSHLGDGGQSEIVGESDVIFYFSNYYASLNGTDVGCGQIPEIYYYAD